jgi:hypothetical protein
LASPTPIHRLKIEADLEGGWDSTGG